MESDASPSRCFGQSFVVSTMSVRGDFSAVPGRRLRGQEPFAERRGGGGAPPAGGACFSGNAHPRTPSEDGLGSDLKQAATKGGPRAKRKRSGWPCWLGATPLGRRNPGTEGSSWWFRKPRQRRSQSAQRQCGAPAPHLGRALVQTLKAKRLPVTDGVLIVERDSMQISTPDVCRDSCSALSVLRGLLFFCFFRRGTYPLIYIQLFWFPGSCSFWVLRRTYPFPYIQLFRLPRGCCSGFFGERIRFPIPSASGF
jgi:hypothetical protein